MTENKTKRKDLIKNIAIIFLVVLLLLTFFSNTIMNWSLPEVSGQYAGYGTITSSIRGSGTVTANQGYSVVITETREIKEVLIRKGDKVEAGQVVFRLEEGDSTELEAAREQLDTLEYNYKLALIQSGSSSYAGLENDLSDLKAQLKDAQNALAKLADYADTDAIEAQRKEAMALVQDWTEKVEALETKISGLDASIDTGDPVVAGVQKARDEAKAADDAALARYNELLTFTSDLENAQNAVTSAEKRLSELLTAQAAAEKDYAYKHPMLDAYNKARTRLQNANTQLNEWYMTLEQQEADPEGYAAALRELRDAETAMSALTPVDKEEVESLEGQLVVFKDDIYYTTRELEEAREILAICNPDELDLSEVRLETARAKQAQRETAAALAAAQRDLDAAAAARKVTLREELAAAKAEESAASDALKAADKLAEKNQEYQTAAALVDQIQKSIQAKNREIENAKKMGSAEEQRTYLELQKQQKDIEKQKEVVEKLEARRLGVDVTAKYAGEVTAVNVMAGDKVTPDMALAQIGIEGKGYTMLVSVTNEQSRRLSVGDQAKVNNYWWGDIRITLAAIRTDRNNPGQGKILEFNVEGDVVDGQSLEITIGERSNSYNLVVPNSAVREDSKGTFILIARAKNTPLGNRYTAERVDVTVLEKDAYNSALDAGTDFGYEYVITTSTRPLEAGTLVRLAEN
jgi:chromosome segregation ATPase